MALRTFFASRPDDDEETRLEKFTIFLVAGSCCLAGILWMAMYWAVFGWGLTAALPLAFVAIVGFSLFAAHRRRDHAIAVYAQIVCIIYITAIIQWNIGGVFDSGFIMVWSLMGPLAALMFFPWRRAVLWFLAFLANLAVTIVFDDYFSAHGEVVTEGVRLLFFGMNLGIGSFVIFLFAAYYVSNARLERARSERLLLNVLPKEIAPILKSSEGTFARHYESASVLFADIVGSTLLFTELEPGAAVDWLNEVFTIFDDLVGRHGLEKIRTIGDNYMVAAGVPVPRPDHAHALAALGLDMMAALESIPPRSGKRLDFRIGINSGPLVAGVIGQSKFHYDVYGDTVNTASRMESTGEAGKIHLTGATYALVRDEYECVERGSLEVKGKGTMETWYLVGRKG